MPLVSVVMPVYNAAEYLEDAVESILRQTFRDFEFIIINDGSTDGSSELLDLIQKKDSRVKVYHQENSGIVSALNKGCDIAQGKYIFRMDSDDISLPERIACQVSFLEKNPDVGVCGTWIQLFGSINGDIWKTPKDHETIRCRLLFASPLNHPTVAMRRCLISDLNLRYRHGYDHAEDYDLWERLSHHTRLANLQKVMLLYRTHSNQVSLKHNAKKMESASKIRKRQIIALVIQPTPRQLQLHESICSSPIQPVKETLDEIEQWLCTLMDANTKKRTYDKKTFQRYLATLWFNICVGATKHGIWTWKKFHSSPISKNIQMSFFQKKKFLIKCLLRRASHA